MNILTFERIMDYLNTDTDNKNKKLFSGDNEITFS